MLLSLFFRCAKEKEVNKSSNYAAVAADTFSSELGILSKSNPRLITSLTLREVPRGTNGGVTTYGLLAGVFGAFTVALTSAILLPFDLSGNQSDGSGLYVKERVLWTLAMTVWGALGSVLDSILGSLLQASVVDKATNRVVEGDGGRRVRTYIMQHFSCILLKQCDRSLFTPLLRRVEEQPMPRLAHPTTPGTCVPGKQRLPPMTLNRTKVKTMKVDGSRADETCWIITW